MDIPPELKDKLAQYQNLKSSVQAFMVQKQEIMQRMNEVEDAINSLEKYSEGRIYKISGPILIETNKENSMAKLKEEKEVSDVRIKAIERQEVKLKEMVSKLESEIQTAIKGYEMPQQ